MPSSKPRPAISGCRMPCLLGLSHVLQRAGLVMVSSPKKDVLSVFVFMLVNPVSGRVSWKISQGNLCLMYSVMQSPLTSAPISLAPGSVYVHLGQTKPLTFRGIDRSDPLFRSLVTINNQECGTPGSGYLDQPCYGEKNVIPLKI